MRDRPHRIIIYNHKGGVGKTTLTFHIAAALAALSRINHVNIVFGSNVSFGVSFRQYSKPGSESALR